VKYILFVLGSGLLIGAVFIGLRFGKVVFLILQTSPYTQQGNGKTLHVLGDSTGYGTGVRDPKDSIAGRIGQDYPNLRITNDSVNGRTIGELVPVVDALVGNYDVILLQIGGNDVLQSRPADVVARELGLIFEKLQNHTDHIIMMSSGNVGGATAFTGGKADEMTRQKLLLREVYMITSDAYKVTYVDLYVEPTEDLFVLEPKRYQATDGLHPSADGYGLWYEKLRPIVAAALGGA
jgi:lysophospholipase L1-like esterase